MREEAEGGSSIHPETPLRLLAGDDYQLPGGGGVNRRQAAQFPDLKAQLPGWSHCQASSPNFQWE